MQEGVESYLWCIYMGLPMAAFKRAWPYKFRNRTHREADTEKCIN